MARSCPQKAVLDFLEVSAEEFWFTMTPQGKILSGLIALPKE